MVWGVVVLRFFLVFVKVKGWFWFLRGLGFDFGNVASILKVLEKRALDFW